MMETVTLWRCERYGGVVVMETCYSCEHDCPPAKTDYTRLPAGKVVVDGEAITRAIHCLTTCGICPTSEMMGSCMVSKSRPDCVICWHTYLTANGEGSEQ